MITEKYLDRVMTSISAVIILLVYLISMLQFHLRDFENTVLKFYSQCIMS